MASASPPGRESLCRSPVTFVSVPLILLGMLLHLLPLAAVESAIWFAADKSLAGLFWLLMRLPDGWQNVDQRWQTPHYCRG